MTRQPSFSLIYIDVKVKCWCPNVLPLLIFVFGVSRLLGDELPCDMRIPSDKQDKLHGCLEHLFNQVSWGVWVQWNLSWLWSAALCDFLIDLTNYVLTKSKEQKARSHKLNPLPLQPCKVAQQRYGGVVFVMVNIWAKLPSEAPFVQWSGSWFSLSSFTWFPLLYFCFSIIFFSPLHAHTDTQAFTDRSTRPSAFSSLPMITRCHLTPRGVQPLWLP